MMNKSLGNQLRFHTNYRNLSFRTLREESILDFSSLRSLEMTIRRDIIYNCKKILCVAIATITTIVATAQSHIYMSPQGSDSNSGSPEAPLFSLQKALDKAISTTADDTAYIEVAAGDYYLTSGACITTPTTRPIVVRAAGPEKPRFIGGRRITDWQQLNNSLYSAYIPEAVWGDYTFEQFFVNGRRATLARTPNKGFYRIKSIKESVTDNGNSTKESFATMRIEGDSAQLAILKDVWAGENGQPKVSLYHKWNNAKMHIDIINKDSNTFNIAGRKWGDHYMLQSGSRYFLYDFRQALDSVGEWYMDYTNGRLYYIRLPHEDMSNAQCIVPTIKQFINLTGHPGREIENISFENICFIVSKFNVPRAGLYPFQAAADIGAAIELHYAKNISFTGCEIEHCGTYAIWIDRGSSNCKVQGCYIGDAGAGGIKIGSPVAPDDTASVARGNIIDNNIIRGGGREIATGVGVHIMHAADNRVTQNDISDLRYTGISVGWRWGYGASVAAGNIIAHNHIHHIGWAELSDMGGIYTLGAATGNCITGNVIHDIAADSYGAWGIYTDEGSSYIEISNNLVYRCNDGAFHQHYGKENRVENNIFAFGKNYQLQLTKAEEHSSFTFKHNIILQNSGRTATGKWFTANMEIADNIYWSYGDTLSFCGKSSKEWEQLREKSARFINPQMKNPLADDFSFKKKRAARKIGFKPFDYSKAGVYGSEQWRKRAQEGNAVHNEFIEATGM